MIKTVSDLLNQLQLKEKELLKKYSIIKHPGLIGSMYEGLTKDILNNAVFDGLGVKVTSGKIRNTKGEFSDEIDCMIVIGDGEEIPYTEKHIYESDKVIAVLQVKKNLFSKDLSDSYDNLRSVVEITDIREGNDYHIRMLRDAWRAIFKEELPKRDELKNLDFNKEMIYHTLLMEMFYPARIVWGYEGFKSEYKLRDAFVKYLDENVSTEMDKKFGYGPLNFPTVLICDKYSLIKANGVPYAHPIVENEYWPFYVSSNQNPVYFLLEAIWTRLHYMFKISAEIFGDDLEIEAFHPFLLARCRKLDSKMGWEYEIVPLTKKQLETPLRTVDWEPVFISEFQFRFFNYLGVAGVIDCESEEMKDDILKNGYSVESFLKEIRETGLVDIKGTEVRFITDQCVSGITMDGRFYCGDNKTGRVSRWLMKDIISSNHPPKS